MSSEIDIGTLHGSVELDDHLTPTVNLSISSIDRLTEHMGHLGPSVHEMAEGFLGAELAVEALKEGMHLLIETVKELTIEGSKVAGVEKAFDHLTEAAGHTADVLLGKLREGTKNTITDFELMKRANMDLAAGLNLTDDQFGLLARGATALAKAEGTDLAAAFDKMNDAMVTGRVKSVALLIGKQDLKAAEEKYAAAAGHTVDQLTAEGKLEIARETILRGVAAALDRVGESQGGVGTSLAQIRTSWANFQEDIGKTIASSPVIKAAFKDMADAINEAMGQNKEELIHLLTEAIKGLAEFAVTATHAIVELAHILGETTKFVVDHAEAFRIAGVAIGGYILAVKGITIATEAYVALAPGMALVTGAWEALSFASIAEATTSISLLGEAALGVTTAFIAWPAAVAAAVGAVLYGISRLESAKQLSNAPKDQLKAWAIPTGGPEDVINDMLRARGINVPLEGRNLTAEKPMSMPGPAADSSGLQKALTDFRTLGSASTQFFQSSAKDLKDYREAWQQLNSMGSNAFDTIASINPKILEQVDYYFKMGASVELVAKAYPSLTKEQVTAADTVFKLKEAYIPLNKEQSEVIANAVRHEQSIQLVAKAYGINAVAAEQYAKTLKELKKVEQDVAVGMVSESALGEASKQAGIVEMANVKLRLKNFSDLKKAQKEYDDSIARDTLDAYDYQIKIIEEHLQKQKEDLQAAGGNWAATFELLRATANHEIDMIEWDRLQDRIDEADRATEEWQQKLKRNAADLAGMFGSIGSSIGGGSGSYVSMIGGIISGMQKLQQLNIDSGGSGGGVLGKSLQFIGSPKARSAVANYGQAVASGLNAKTGGTDEAGNPTTFNETMNSAMAWDNAGTYAAAVGTMGISLGVQAAIGGLKYLFRDRTLEDAARDAGERFGVKFSKATMDAIQAAKDKGARVIVAEQLNLQSIIGDAGGLNTKNLDRFAQQYRDTFAMLAQGWMSVKDATKIIDDNWQTFIATGVDGAGRLNAKLKEMVSLDQQFGTQSKEIAAYLKQQGETAVDAFVNIVAAADEADAGYASLKKSVDDAQAAVDELSKAGKQGTDEWTKANDDLTKALTDQHKAAEGARQELEDYGVEAIAAFSAAVAAGDTVAEALTRIHPALQNLKKMYQDLGIDVDNVALKNLMMQDTITSGNPALMGALSGLKGELVALDNMGLMNADTFGAMERTGMQLYTRLQAKVAEAGGSIKDALLPMQDYLHQAMIEAELLGVPLDHNTQMLIDQSKELGIWKDKGKSAVDQLTDSMTKLVDKVQLLVDTLNGVPPSVHTTVTVDTQNPDGTPANPGGDTGQGGGDTGDTGGYSTGTITPRYLTDGALVSFTPRGSDVVPAMLTPEEEVVSVGDRRTIKSMIEGMTGGQGQTIQMNIQLVMGDKSMGRATKEVFIPALKGEIRSSGETKRDLQVLLGID